VNELRAMRNEAAPADELRRAKDHLKGSLMLSLESTSARMGNLARQSMYFGRFFTLDELNESIESVTAEHVQAVAREFFTSENAGLVVLGKLEGLSIERSDLEIQ
jgi:predicted Zn-dependent peptidase